MPEAIYSTQEFISAITANTLCPGGLIDNVIKLEALRNCVIITSSLIIATLDADADYTAVFSISKIQGEHPIVAFVSCSSPD